MNILLWLCVAVGFIGVALLLLVLWCCCAISSQCSEEEREKYGEGR